MLYSSVLWILCFMLYQMLQTLFDRLENNLSLIDNGDVNLNSASEKEWAKLYDWLQIQWSLTCPNFLWWIILLANLYLLQVPPWLGQKKLCAFNEEAPKKKRYNCFWSGTVWHNPRFKTDPGNFLLSLQHTDWVLEVTAASWRLGRESPDVGKTEACPSVSWEVDLMCGKKRCLMSHVFWGEGKQKYFHHFRSRSELWILIHSNRTATQYKVP